MTRIQKSPPVEPESTRPAATIARAHAEFLRLIAGLIADQWVQDHSAPGSTPANNAGGATTTELPKE